MHVVPRKHFLKIFLKILKKYFLGTGMKDDGIDIVVARIRVQDAECANYYQFMTLGLAQVHPTGKRSHPVVYLNLL